MTVLTGVVSFPIPLYSNVPIMPQFFQPSRFVISDITLGVTTIITTTENINYVVGQEIRLLIPSTFGTIELNGQTGFVFSLPASNQVEVNINSINFNEFINSSDPLQSAQIVAIGDVNTGYQSTTGPRISTINGNTNIEVPGSFINISPQ